MNLSKKVITFVIGLAAIALIGLAVIQVRNLNSSIETNRHIFLQKVDLCSQKIADNFTGNEANVKLLFDAVRYVGKTGDLNDPELDEYMRLMIDGVFDEYGLDMDYEYAIYKHAELANPSDAPLFSFVLGDKGTSLGFELTGCIDPQERGHAWSTLTCNMNYEGNEGYHLAVFFPNKETYIFTQSSGALILSIVFILLLLCCFAYMLIVIQRQKKLSVIKNDFINNLTHEFKTPIASISLATSMLKRDDEEIDERRRANYLDLIDSESKRLEGQVDKVLQIAMIDSGNFSLDKKELDIHEVILRVVNGMDLIVNKRKGKIKLHLRAIRSTVTADETHLVNIIYNLVDNALKYTIDTPEIVISTRDSDRGVEVSIKDNGIGIGEEIQKYIFDKFYRAETGDVHNVKGFGLGLSYVKKIIEAHSGKIDLSSQLDQGSEFRLFFPQS